ncbi:hypothetical protein AAG570_007648 [Ranatra chinensis]|uniref:E3 ubiquitin-protein ligase APD1-4 middle domain-containing protein n=1 Tax=Ranatra chinensis TaxID=642074 RepID=A0ABD0YFY1_9HEMI
MDLSRGYSKRRKKKPTKTALKVVSLFIMTVFVPGFLLGTPVYMRYFVYQDQIYPVGMLDTRLVDARMSTTWCQSQIIQSNATFNAYLVSDYPEINSGLYPVSMTRHIMLDDDMKEYWGFYLLKGSLVTVSTCARWPGASLMIIKGHKHLRRCAYIGDDSSEELDELNELQKAKDKDVPSNDPAIMTKINPEVMVNGHNITDRLHGDVLKVDTLEEIPTGNSIEENRLDNRMGNYVHLNYAEKIDGPDRRNKWYETKKFAFSDSKRPQLTSKEVLNEMLVKLKKMGKTGKHILEELNREMSEGNEKPALDRKPKDGPRKSKLSRKRRHAAMKLLSGPLESQEADEENEGAEVDIGEIHGSVNETNSKDRSDSEFWSSFSSSEERLLSCDGLLLNLPLSFGSRCRPSATESQLEAASVENSVTYRIPSDGYYFFVFNSENEVQTNFLSAKFKIEKTTYNVSGAEATCLNANGSCSFQLRFGSSQKVVLELVHKPNETHWNEEFITISICEPRSSVYAVFIIAAPLMFIIFAFQ